MSALAEPKFAWEPVTPRGVAVFARASYERLLVVQCLVALLSVGAVLWLLADGVFPTISAAIDRMPDGGALQGGVLDWRGTNPIMLAEGNILALSVDLEHGGALRSPADFQLEFGKKSVRAFSLLGEMQTPYPSDYIIAANRPEARPAWRAWSPEILGLTAACVFFGLLLVWTILATLYTLPVWLISFFANRDLGLAASWKLAAAALLPGALFQALAIIAYDFGWLDLVQLGGAFGLHFVIGWLYLVVSPVFLNRTQPGDKKNPFGAK